MLRLILASLVCSLSIEEVALSKDWSSLRCYDRQPRIGPFLSGDASPHCSKPTSQRGEGWNPSRLTDSQPNTKNKNTSARGTKTDTQRNLFQAKTLAPSSGGTGSMLKSARKMLM